MGGGTDGVSHEGSVAKVNGNRNVPYLNKNGSKRNLNLNWWNDDWNPDYRFLAVRHVHCFSRPTMAGVLFCNCLRHPPSILPASARHSERCTYLFVSSDCISHAS